MNRPCIVFHGTVDNGFNRAIRPICQAFGIATVRVPYQGPEPLRSLHEVHLTWGLKHNPEIQKQLAAQGNVWTAENGWIRQKDGVFIDPQGPNGMSSLIGTVAAQPPLTDLQRSQLNDWIASAHTRTRSTATVDQGFIYAPLQVEGDTNIRYWSGCGGPPRRKLEWWVEQVCQAFPDYPIVFRPHPLLLGIVAHCRRMKAFTAHKQAIFDSTYSSYHWAARAHAVVGINSTVLIEALTYNKPVFAIGKGVFSNNGVMLDAYRQVERLREVLDYKPDVERIAKFLHMLMCEQIPYDVTPDTARDYPSLMALIECARHLPERTIQDMKVYAMLPSPDPKTAMNIGDNKHAKDPDVDQPAWGQIPPVVADARLAKSNGCSGVMVVDPMVDGAHNDLYKAIREADLDLIICCQGAKRPEQDTGLVERVERARRHTRKIAVANAGCEFASRAGNSRAKQMHDISRALHFTWICNLTPGSICWDIMKPDWPLRKFLVEKNVQCFSLSSYVLFAYLYWDDRMPHVEDISIHGQDLHGTFKLSIDRLRAWCEPLDIYSAAGGVQGMANGTLIYARECGFKGILSYMPIDLKTASHAPARPSRATYPAACTYKEISKGE